MKNTNLPILVLLFLGLAAAAFAQAPAVIVEYYENTSGEMYVRTADGAEYGVDQFGFGEQLPVGTTLFTLDGDYAELRMDPTGTIIRVGENTNFRVDGLQGGDGAHRNTFSVAVGKFKAVVAKRDGSLYSFRGASAVMGVRGTTFIWSIIPGVEELAYVVDGIVEYTNAAGETLALEAGQAANALAADFTRFRAGASLRQNLERGMEFVRLRVNEVPGYAEEVAEEVEELEEEAEEAVEEAVEEAAEAEPEPEEGKGEVKEVTPEKKAEGMAEEPVTTARRETPAWLEKMMTFLGVELGTTTIFDRDRNEPVTWARAVIQPRFAFGKLKLALYLPIIYQDDMLDPSDWHKPDGNNEWSFGTDQDGWDEVALDFLLDLSRKIRYIQWADSRDPFFFKIGNIDNFALGHGSIMRNYANDINFPAERKLGLNLGVNREKGGLELMLNDAGDPEIFGFRAHTRPFAPALKLGLGLSALADINPERLDYGETAAYGKPMFFNAGVDLDQPIVEREALSIIAFADVASMIPYFREDGSYTDPETSITYNASAGLGADAVWYDGRPKNWGVDAGVFGKLSILDYRLEFLYSDGIFESPFYGPLYDLRSVNKVTALIQYLDNPDDPQFDRQRMGVYGELGYTLEKVFYISGGYNWNWPIDPVPGEFADDTFWVELGLFKELLPVYGSISLTRVGLAAPLVNGESITFFDENLLLSGVVAYPISPILELAVEVRSNVIEGEWYPSVSVLTRLNG
jgi:uncharacterized cupin superfamily protein